MDTIKSACPFSWQSLASNNLKSFDLLAEDMAAEMVKSVHVFANNHEDI